MTADELCALIVFGKITGIALLLHTEKECDTSVVLLVYGPCMVVVVKRKVTSSPCHDTMGLHAKLYDPVEETSAWSRIGNESFRQDL